MKGSVRPRSKGKWQITIDTGTDPATGKRLRHFETVTGTKRGAHIRLAELLVAIDQGSYIRQPRKLTVAEYLAGWLSAHAESNLAAKTRESYRHEMAVYIVPAIGWLKLTDLRPQHIQDYIGKGLSTGKKRGGGLSLRTLQYHYRILSKALSDAVRMGLLAVNPCRGVSPPKPARRDIPSYNQDDVKKLVSAISESSHPLLYTTLLMTGLRRGEALALTWRDVDLELACLYVSHSLLKLDDGTVIIKGPKTARSRRMVDLPPSLALSLRDHKSNQEVQMILIGRNLRTDDFIFSHEDGSPLNPNTITHDFGKVAKKAGFVGLRLHDLRHLHATMLLKMGTHPRIVQERLGHSSITTTLDIYSHTVPGLQKAAAERLDQLLPKIEPGQNVGKMSAEGGEVESEPSGARTRHHLIKSQVLYQLS